MSEDAADPDMREVAADAYASLLRVKGHDSSADLAAQRSADEAVRGDPCMHPLHTCHFMLQKIDDLPCCLRAGASNAAMHQFLLQGSLMEVCWVRRRRPGTSPARSCATASSAWHMVRRASVCRNPLLNCCHVCGEVASTDHSYWADEAVVAMRRRAHLAEECEPAPLPRPALRPVRRQRRRQGAPRPHAFSLHSVPPLVAPFHPCKEACTTTCHFPDQVCL